MRLRFDDLNSVVELYSQDDFGQEAVAFETAPVLFGSLRELEDHRQRGLIGEATLRSSRTMTDGSKCALDWVGGPQVFPMFGGKVVEGEQRVTILGNALGRFLVFAAVGLDGGGRRQKRERSAGANDSGLALGKSDGQGKKNKARTAARYKDPQSDKTWSGRGRPPAWLVGDREQYAL